MHGTEQIEVIISYLNLNKSLWWLENTYLSLVMTIQIMDFFLIGERKFVEIYQCSFKNLSPNSVFSIETLTLLQYLRCPLSQQISQAIQIQITDFFFKLTNGSLLKYVSIVSRTCPQIQCLLYRNFDWKIREILAFESNEIMIN